jgi:hypothetical protein
MTTKNRPRRQRAFKGGRIQGGHALEPRIQKALDHTCAKFSVSRPLVITIALAHYFGIEQDERL